MAETSFEKNLAKERLEQYLATHDIKVAKTFEELLGPDTEQTQEKIHAEVDEFLRMREECVRKILTGGLNSGGRANVRRSACDA